METYTNYYFKDQDPTRPLMSGRPLPKDSDGVVRGKRFVDCNFHPNCQDVKFENCIFERCSPKPETPRSPVVFDPKRIGMPPAPLIEIAPDEWR